MTARQRVWAIVAGSTIVITLLAAGALWLSGATETAKFDAGLMDTTAVEEAPEERGDAGESKQDAADITVPGELATSDDGSSESDAVSGAEKDQTVTEDERQFCFVTAVTWEGGQAELTVDYAQMLTGRAAAAAAAAAGDESPPPNDYYIVNENPRLRTFPVKSELMVRMASSTEGARPEGYDMPFAEWYDAYSGMSGSFPGIRNVPYWVTVSEGIVVKLEEQFLP